MNTQETLIEEKINNLENTLKTNEFFGDKLSFKIGNFVDILKAELKDKCFYGRVAVLAFQNTFLTLSPLFKDSFSENKILPMEYLFNDKDDLSIENLSKLFLLPDTIRAVIVLDSELSNIGGYFATVKKIPLFILTCGLNAGEAIENTFYIKNSSQYDLFTVSAKKYVLIDFNLKNKLNIQYSSGFDYCLNNLVSLIDYKINSYFTNKALNVNLYNAKNKAIVSAFSCTKKPEEERLVVLTVASITCGMVNAIMGEEYLKNNSTFNTLLLYGKEPYLSKDIMLYFTEKIMDLYGVLCEANEDRLYLIKDYNEVSKSLKEEKEISEDIILDNLLKQAEVIKKSKYTINDFADNFGGEILSLSDSLKKVNSIHIALGGKETSKIIDKDRLKFSLKYAGALTESITGLSLLIHSGINKLI